jgi:hypothetical protein
LTHAWVRDAVGQYPAYLREQTGRLAPEDARRYQRQYELTVQIVALYDAQATPDTRRLMELMTEVRRSVQRPYICLCLYVRVRVYVYVYVCVRASVPFLLMA